MSEKLYTLPSRVQFGESYSLSSPSLSIYIPICYILQHTSKPVRTLGMPHICTISTQNNKTNSPPSRLDRRGHKILLRPNPRRRLQARRECSSEARQHIHGLRVRHRRANWRHD